MRFLARHLALAFAAGMVNLDVPYIRLDRQTQPPAESPSRLPRVMLEIVRGRARRLVRRIAPPVFLIGAAADCDLVLADEQFPDAFAYVYVTATGVSIRHLGSRPDLLVNGEMVESALLDDGDRLQMGPYEFQINIHACDPRGGGIRAHDEDGATVPYDLLGLDTAAGQVHHLLAEIRQSVPMPEVDWRWFDGPADDRQQLKQLARRPLAAFVTRRASA